MDDPPISLKIFIFFLALGSIAAAAPFVIGQDRWTRLKTWLISLPWLLAVLKWKRSKPPIFGERDLRPKSPTWQDFPEWVLIPKFAGLRKPVRIFLRIIWFVLILFPYVFYEGMRAMYSLLFGFKEYIEQQPRGERDLRPETIYRHAGIGSRSVSGGKKGGSSNARTRAVAQRNEDIRVEARELLECGKRYDELAGYFAKEYGDLDGYPSTSTQYRNILAPLREEAEVNKS